MAGVHDLAGDGELMFLYAPPGPLPADRLRASLLFLAQAIVEEAEVAVRVPHPDRDAVLEELIASGQIQRLERASLEARVGSLGPRTLIDVWESAHPDMQLVWHEDGSALRHHDLVDLVARLRGVLHRKGVRPGDTVLVEVVAQPVCWATWWAVVTSGCVAAVMVPGLTGAPLRHVCALAKARLAIVLSPETLADLPIEGLSAGEAGSSLFDDMGEPAPITVRPRSTDRATARFTSGTTGLPKGVALTHGSMTRVALVWAAELGDPADRHLMWGNQAHTLGLRHMMILPVLLGTTLICADRVNHPLELIRLAVDHSSTILHTNPTFWLSVCRMETALAEVLGEHRFRQIGSTTAPLPEEVRNRTEALFGVPVTNFFGTSESAGVHILRVGDGVGSGRGFHALTDVFDGEERCAPGTVGKLRVFSPRISDGYLDGRPLMRDDCGWLATGDHAHIDAGNVVLHGRFDDVFIHRLGNNVHMGAVQRVIELQDGVLAASVVGVEIRGVFRLAALVVGDVDLEGLRRALPALLPPDHIPERWQEATHIPRTGAGKIDRQAVAALFMEPS